MARARTGRKKWMKKSMGRAGTFLSTVSEFCNDTDIAIVQNFKHRILHLFWNVIHCWQRDWSRSPWKLSWSEDYPGSARISEDQQTKSSSTLARGKCKVGKRPTYYICLPEKSPVLRLSLPSGLNTVLVSLTRPQIGTLSKRKLII